MAIKLKDGTILRNLEEQVQYLTNYHDINQGLAQWGIRVVGQVEAVAELPPAATYEGEYGDAYAVGTEAPFNFYIWTRAAIVGDPGYWFPFGEISIVGPQGPQGPKGAKGDTGESTRWYTSNGNPGYDASNYNIGDQWLNTINGDVSQVILAVDRITKIWSYKGNIRGPQGIQGPQGPKGADGKDGAPGPQGPQGDVGGFINIWGIVANTDQLPTPASLNNLTVAYLVEHAGGSDATNDHYDLYIQVGESSSTALWTNAGPFNAATLVTSGGVGLNVWDADSKLDKNTEITERDQVYVKAANGTEKMLDITLGQDAYSAGNKIINQDYLKNNCVSRIPSGWSSPRIYGKNRYELNDKLTGFAGWSSDYRQNNDIQKDSIAMYDSNKQLSSLDMDGNISAVLCQGDMYRYIQEKLWASPIYLINGNGEIKYSFNYLAQSNAPAEIYTFPEMLAEIIGTGENPYGTMAALSGHIITGTLDENEYTVSPNTIYIRAINEEGFPVNLKIDLLEAERWYTEGIDKITVSVHTFNGTINTFTLAEKDFFEDSGADYYYVMTRIFSP